MKATIFAAFDDPHDAEKAAGALLDHGLKNEDISLLVHSSHEQTEAIAQSVKQAPKPIEQVIEENETTGTSIGHAAVNDFGRSVVEPEGAWEQGLNMAYGYEMAGGIESTDAATHYPRGDEAYDTDGGAPSLNPESASLPIAGESGLHAVAVQRETVGAKTGLTTTTGADAGLGAAKGFVVGTGVGILAALAAMFIPGIGIVAGAGALSAAIAGTAGAAGAGIIAGGIYGYLKDQGVPEEALTVYHEAFDRGGAILAVNITERQSRAEIEAVLAKYGAENVELYSPAVR